MVIMTREHWLRARELSWLYCACSEPEWNAEPEQLRCISERYPAATDPSDCLAWKSGQLSAIERGIPGLPGLGPLRAAKYVLAEYHVVNADERRVDISALEQLVVSWLRMRRIIVHDDRGVDAS